MPTGRQVDSPEQKTSLEQEANTFFDLHSQLADLPAEKVPTFDEPHLPQPETEVPLPEPFEAKLAIRPPTSPGWLGEKPAPSEPPLLRPETVAEPRALTQAIPPQRTPPKQRVQERAQFRAQERGARMRQKGQFVPPPALSADRPAQRREDVSLPQRDSPRGETAPEGESDEENRPAQRREDVSAFERATKEDSGEPEQTVEAKAKARAQQRAGRLSGQSSGVAAGEEPSLYGGRAASGGEQKAVTMLQKIDEGINKLVEQQKATVQALEKIANSGPKAGAWGQ